MNPPRHSVLGLAVPSAAFGIALFFQPPTLAATPLPVVTPQRTSAVDFETEILPVLKKNCLACHNQTRAKADLVLETPAMIAKGGASGPSLVPGKGEESLVFKSAAHRVDDLVMPPTGNKSNAANLTPEELGLLRLWIDQGAQGEVRSGSNLAWQAIPDSWKVSYAVAFDRDALLIAGARANRVSFYDARTGEPAGRLEDPELGGATQRDIVHALAFSPSEDLVASAGFREVLLWKRQPARLQEIARAPSGTEWIHAAVSPDSSRVAVVTSAGDLELRRIDNGEAIATWPALTSTPALAAVSPDGSRIAVAGASGTLRIATVEGSLASVEPTLESEPSAVAWFDNGLALAVATRDAKTIRTWRLSGIDGSPKWVAGATLAGHETPVVGLAAEDSGLLVSASSDGQVFRWTTDPQQPPSRVACGSPVVSIRTARSAGRVLVAFADGGSGLVEFGDKPAVTRRFLGDPRREAAAAAADQALALSRLELSQADKSIQEGEAESKKASEALAKAKEKREAQAKALEEKTQNLAKNQQTETEAAKERDQIAADLQRALDESAAAEKASAEAKTTAREAAERATAARLAVEQAERSKSELERLVQSLAGRADEAALAKAREAAEAAAADAASKTRVTGDSRSGAEKALDDLATLAFAAGQKKALADRAQADLPPKKKQAEEKAAAAKKAADDLRPQIEKARITLEGGEKDIQLAEQSSEKIGKSVVQSKATAESARRRIGEQEATLAERQKARASAASRRHVLAATSPRPGHPAVTLDSESTLVRWDTSSGAPSFLHAYNGDTPLALIPVASEETVVVSSRTMTRVDASPRWEKVRTLGSPESTPPPASPLVDRVNALAFSPDGQFLATGGGEPSRSGELKLWRVADGTLVRDFGSSHSDCVLAIAFSPRGERLATGGADRFARISEVASGKVLRNFEGHTHHVMSVAWLAHGAILASGGAEGTMKIWNVTTGDRLKNVDGFGKEITGLHAVGVTNQFVAVAGSGQARIVRDNGEKVRDLPGAPSFLEALATTADGKWAAVAADDGVLRIWDLESGKERFALAPP